MFFFFNMQQLWGIETWIWNLDMCVTLTHCRFDSVAFPQLSDSISIIGREDFPQKWPDLLTEMVTRFQSGDFHIINGVLRTAHSLFKRYVRNSMASSLCKTTYLEHSKQPWLWKRSENLVIGQEGMASSFYLMAAAAVPQKKTFKPFLWGPFIIN